MAILSCKINQALLLFSFTVINFQVVIDQKKAKIKNDTKRNFMIDLKNSKSTYGAYY